jgi:hypothetical protein
MSQARQTYLLRMVFVDLALVGEHRRGGTKVGRFVRQYFLAAVGILAALIRTLRPTFGAELKFPSGPYISPVVDRDTKDLLEDFGRTIHVPVDVAAGSRVARVDLFLPAPSKIS